MPPLGHWLVAFGVPSVLSIVVTYVVMRVFFRADLNCRIEHSAAAGKAHNIRQSCPLGIGPRRCSLAHGFGDEQGPRSPHLPRRPRHHSTRLTCSQKQSPQALPRDQLEHDPARCRPLHHGRRGGESGRSETDPAWLLPGRSASHPPQRRSLVGFTVGVGNNLVNNLPLGLIAGATHPNAAHIKGLLANAVLIGVDLGPNLSVTGSLATILWLLALRKENLNVSVWKFLQAWDDCHANRVGSRARRSHPHGQALSLSSCLKHRRELQLLRGMLVHVRMEVRATTGLVKPRRPNNNQLLALPQPLRMDRRLPTNHAHR